MNIPVSLEEEIRGYQAGQLWPYLENAAVFHCPADTRWKSLDRGYRSISIQGMMNGENSPTTPGYARKTSDILNPADKYVFIENVDPRGWNMGSWIMNWNTKSPSLIDPIAAFHSGRTALGFADGHAVHHIWQGPRLIDWANSCVDGSPNFSFSFTVSDWNSPEARDVLFLAKGYIPGRH
jgi:prepilin-type processing-associated H-X9-DG protein